MSGELQGLDEMITLLENMSMCAIVLDGFVASVVTVDETEASDDV